MGLGSPRREVIAALRAQGKRHPGTEKRFQKRLEEEIKELLEDLLRCRHPRREIKRALTHLSKFDSEEN